MKFKDLAVGHQFTRDIIPAKSGANPVWLKIEEIAYQNAVPLTGTFAGFTEHIHPDTPVTLVEESNV